MTAEVRQSRRSDVRDNRARILAAARAAFAQEGLDVPIREIARRAQVGPATVYRHFPTKESLLTAAFGEGMTLCSQIVDEGRADPDPWHGFRETIFRLMEMRALGRSFSHAFVSRLPASVGLAADRDRALRGMRELLSKAKEAGDLRADIVLEDVVLTMTANEGIRAESPALRAAAARRFAALMIQSFQAHPGVSPLPPAVRLPLR
ncbi:TetR/AcrR family transcriptional regulator [Streptosporangium sp. NPDC000509]|uniref:TetR/AcrR family transcriptional regulator n=1 Tax=Streptosporangium sp. NPDC000509 TaxID=3366186 RepID=UPI00367E9347